MSVVTGTYRKGKVVLDSSVDWPDGTTVEVTAPTTRIGLTEADWPTTPEGIAELRQRMASLKPVGLTPEEEAEWQAWREEVKQYTLKKMRDQ